MISGLRIGTAIHRGGLALFPLWSGEPSAPAYLTGPEATARGVLKVEEVGDGAVPSLTVTVTGDRPVLLVEGERILGNRQERVLDVTVLCPPGTTVVPVSCVEAGRWGAAQPAAPAPRLAPASVREAKVRGVGRAVEKGEARRSDQQSVWDAVGSCVSRLSAPAPTSALEDVHQHVARDVDELVGGLRPAEGQRGVVVAVGGRPVGLDLFDRPDTLATYWDALVGGYALDAVRQLGDCPDAVAVTRFVEAVLSASRREVPGAGLGTEVHLSSAAVTGVALRWEGVSVHLSAFSSPETRSETEPWPVVRRQWFRQQD